MKKQPVIFFILITIIGMVFLSCDNMATLFHGEKPEPPLVIYPEPPPVIYTVTFNANGANGTLPSTQTVNAGTVISLPDKGDLSKEDNIFAGWNERADGTGTTYSIGVSITVTRNMAFYAQWLDGSTPQYTVTFSANGATDGAPPAPQTVYRGISITVPGQGTLAHSGKIFGGWNTQTNGGGTNYVIGALFTVTSDVTLYAKWQSAVQYTVTYHANGASGAVPTAQTVDPGTEITLQGAGAMTYTGKRFTGWRLNAGSTGTLYTAGAAYTVNGNVIFYAQWVSSYTVTFRPNGASGVEPDTRTVDSGTVITLPGEGAMIYSGKMFDGWNTQANGNGTNYAEGAPYTVNANISLYAKWINLPIETPGTTLAAKLTWLETNAASNNTYIIALDYDAGIGPKTLSYSGKSNITLRIKNTVMRTVSLSSNGTLFTVGSGVTLILDSNITLQGRSNSDAYGLVRVNSNGTLIMNAGTRIIGNSISSSSSGSSYQYSSSFSYGGGVYVDGIFTMNGGEISGNTVSSFNAFVGSSNGGLTGGGGVYVNYGTFIMNGGEITGNTVKDSAGGGGVYVARGIFTMNGGEISGNTVSSSYSGSYGGGLYVHQGMFTKNGGTIYGSNGDVTSNTVENNSGTLLNNRGHAVYVGSSSPAKKMESTVEPGGYLYFNYNNGKPVWSGGWE